jgi:serine/threonine-protein kinase
MGTVYVGRLAGPLGFARTVAIKRMHSHLADDPTFRRLFLDEARLAARITHANVVATLDVVAEGEELLVVLEYIAGGSFASLLRSMGKKGTRLPTPVVGAIVSQALHGLHAAHEAVDDLGKPLGIIHRDVAPDNIMVGTDGVSRIVDFGIAKANELGQRTQDGKVKGKIRYMAPEHLQGHVIDRRADVYAAGSVLFEALTGRPLVPGANDVEQIAALSKLTAKDKIPSLALPSLSPEIDRLVTTALAFDRNKRFATALEMAKEVEAALGVASPSAVAELVDAMLASEILRRKSLVEYASLATRELKPESSDIELDTESVRGKADASTSSVALHTKDIEEVKVDLAIALQPTLVSRELTTNQQSPRGKLLDLPPDLPDLMPTNRLENASAPGSTAAPAEVPAAGGEEPKRAVPAPPPRPNVAAAPPLAIAAPHEAALTLGAGDSKASVELEPGVVRRAAPPLESPLMPAPTASPQPQSLSGTPRPRPEAAGPRPRPSGRPAAATAAPRSSDSSAKAWIVLLPVALIGVGLFLFLWLRSADSKDEGTAPTGQALAATNYAEDCDLMRRRLRGGGPSFGLSRQGWQLELWLRPAPGRAIDPKSIDLPALAGEGKATLGELRADEANEGVLVSIEGPRTEWAFDPTKFGELIQQADKIFVESKADTGALILRCAHLRSYETGLWFRSMDAAGLAASMLLTIGLLSDAPFVPVPSTKPTDSRFEGLLKLARARTADYPIVIQKNGGTVENKARGYRATFAPENLGQLFPATRALLDTMNGAEP